MKARYVLVISCGIVLSVLVIGMGTVARAKPPHYQFLGTAMAKKVTLEPDSIGWVGREVRYYVLHKTPHEVATEAQEELSQVGWKRVHNAPAVFGRGEHERIDVRGANQYNDKKLLAGIPLNEISSYTVIKVVDPRIPPALRQRLARWKQPLHRLKIRFA